jgi:integrase
VRGNPPARFAGGRSEKDWPRYHQKGFLAGRSTKQHLAGPLPYQELLGHNQISMTMDIYSHVLPTMQKDAMNKLNDVFQAKGE